MSADPKDPKDKEKEEPQEDDTCEVEESDTDKKAKEIAWLILHENDD